MDELKEQIARIDERTTHIKGSVDKIEKSLTSQYVTKSEFAPVRLLVYTIVGVVLTSVVTGLVALVIK